MSVKYDKDIKPVLSCTEPKTVKNCIKTVKIELDLSNLNVARTYYNYQNEKVDVDVLKSAIGYNEYLQSILEQLENHLEFINNSDAVILNSKDIEDIKKELGLE